MCARTLSKPRLPHSSQQSLDYLVVPKLTDLVFGTEVVLKSV